MNLQPSAYCCIFYPEYVVLLISWSNYNYLKFGLNLGVKPLCFAFFTWFLQRPLFSIHYCSLMSMQLRNRVDVVTVGRLSLNFTGLNRESASIFGNQLCSLIRKLVPYSQAIPMSIEYLNSATLQPRKDNKSGRYIESSIYKIYYIFLFKNIYSFHLKLKYNLYLP